MPAARSPSSTSARTPAWLLAFCYALMGPACAINGAFIAISIPQMAQFGLTGLVVAGAIGALIGILPAIWLARQIHAGISEKE